MIMTEHALPAGAPSSPTPLRRTLLRAGAIFVALACAGFIGLGIFLDGYGQVERATPAQAIVILGASVIAAGVPGDSLTARTKHAVELYRRHYAPKIICTGGVGTYPPAESEVAARLAERLGVPASDLLLEQRSTTTRENTRYAAEICRQHGWSHVIVVSDPYHLWRARHNFAQVGILAFPSPARHCLRNRKLSLRVIWVARETAAVVRDWCCYH